MSILLPKKQEAGAEPKEISPIILNILNTEFDIVKGEWLSEVAFAKKTAFDKLEKDFHNEKIIEDKLESGLARKSILLDRVKQEIEMILKDHCERLESQGFPASQLLTTILSSK